LDRLQRERRGGRHAAEAHRALRLDRSVVVEAGELRLPIGLLAIRSLGERLFLPAWVDQRRAVPPALGIRVGCRELLQDMFGHTIFAEGIGPRVRPRTIGACASEYGLVD